MSPHPSEPRWNSRGVYRFPQRAGTQLADPPSSHVITVTHDDGEWWVRSSSAGADCEPFDRPYIDRETAEKVAHAIFATLIGTGLYHASIDGCACLGDHSR